MSKFIETDRLIIREIETRDDEGMYAMDSDPDVHEYLGKEPVTSIEQIRDVIAFIQQQYADHGTGRWAVEDKQTGAFLGWSGLKYFTDVLNNHQNFYDLGYRFQKVHWGKGYATEASKACVDYGFEKMGLPEIYSHTEAGNNGSMNVLTKSGFRFIETFDNEGDPCHWYRITREEWLNDKASENTKFFP